MFQGLSITPTGTSTAVSQTAIEPARCMSMCVCVCLRVCVRSGVGGWEAVSPAAEAFEMK